MNGRRFEVDADSLRILEGEQVTLGIRPEHVQISPSPSGDSLSLRVDVVQPLVSERKQLLHFDFAGRQVVAKIDAGIEAHVGDSLHVIFERSRLRIFDSRDICVL